MQLTLDISGNKSIFEFDESDSDLIESIETKLKTGNQVSDDDICQTQNFAVFNDQQYDFDDTTVLNEILQLVHNSEPSNVSSESRSEPDESTIAINTSNFMGIGSPQLNDAKRQLQTYLRDLGSSDADIPGLVLQTSLTLSNHLRRRGFKVTKEDAAVLLFAYINSGLSVIPFYTSALASSALALVPGTAYIPEHMWKMPLRAAIYVFCSTSINFFLNGATSNDQFKELRAHYLGDPRYVGEMKKLYQALARNNKPIWKKAIHEFFRLGSGGWSTYSAVSLVQMGRETGMKIWFVPSTFIAFGFLHLGGVNWLLLSLVPAIGKLLYTQTIMRLSFIPKITPTPQEAALGKLKQQRITALKSARMKLLGMLNQPGFGDQDILIELQRLLKDVDSNDIDGLIATFELLAKITALGEEEEKKSTRENVTGRGLQFNMVLGTFIGLFGYVMATYVGVDEVIPDAIASFLPFLMMVLFAGVTKVSWDYAHAAMHPKDTWKHRPIYMRHSPWSSLPFLLVMFLATYVSNGPVLLLARNGLNTLFHKLDWCQNDVEFESLDCENHDQLWNALYWLVAAFAIDVTFFFNPYGLPSAMANGYRVKTRMSCCADKNQDEYRLLEFVDSEIDRISNMSDGAFLSEMQGLTQAVSSTSESEGSSRASEDLNDFFAKHYFATEYTELFLDDPKEEPRVVELPDDDSEAPSMGSSDEEAQIDDDPSATGFVKKINKLYVHFSSEDNKQPDMKPLARDMKGETSATTCGVFSDWCCGKNNDEAEPLLGSSSGQKRSSCWPFSKYQ